MSESHIVNSGRRASDMFLGRIGNIVLLITFLVGVVGFVGKSWVTVNKVTDNIDAIATLAVRVTAIERENHDSFYMVCFLFNKQYVDATPASCDLVLRNNHK